MMISDDVFDNRKWPSWSV